MHPVSIIMHIGLGKAFVRLCSSSHNQIEDRHQFAYKNNVVTSTNVSVSVLTQFLQVCLNPDNEVDYILEYLKIGGNSHEILRQITTDGKKNLSLATPAFHLFHLIILKVQSSLPHMIAITEEACRYFLNNFMSTVEIMISENSGPRHRKIVLKVLTSMVTLNPELGVEVINQAPLTPKHLQHIVEKSNYKEKDNVRTSFVHFMTSFLVDGHLPLIKALLEKQGLLGLVLPGLVYDEAEAVLMFLNILKKNVINNTFISKSLKLKTFNHNVLQNMFKVFLWKGPPELKTESVSESRNDIVTLLSEIILTLFTNHKIGLYFVDTSLGTTDANKNPNLYKALLSLKKPWAVVEEGDVILQIVYKCPDLHRAVISIIEQNFEPQQSPAWEKTVEFTIKLLNKLRPEDMLSRMSKLNPSQVANFIRFIALPVPLLKQMNMNIGKDTVVSIYCVKTIVKMLQVLRRYMQILEMGELLHASELKNRLEYFVPKHLPPPTMVVSMIEEIVANKGTNDTKESILPVIKNADALILLVDLLLLYNDIHPSYFESLEGNINMKKLLQYSVSLQDENVSLLKFKVVSLWLTLDQSVMSVKNNMFQDLFLIMLDVYMSDDDTWIEAKHTLRHFFKNTSIFEADEDEIHLMLYALRKAKVNPPSLIGEIVEYVLEHIQDLEKTVRDQLVNFEISDENCASSLEKLFTDLMDGRSTEDSVFLENKLPSPFVVGCVQFLQSNKDKKKSLKHFLSLYVSNLMHSNSSPEFTEVLIGDTKLDARGYVASWTGEPVTLNEATVGSDEIIRNISKTIIDGQDISLVNVFPFIKNASKQEKDFIIDDVSYKLDTEKHIDGSELLIWAKYLIFCTVKLTDMNRLTEEQQQKISNYIECMIAVSRKLHMIDICRVIILNLFKNPQVLKIYKVVNLNNEDSSLLATKFLLNIIVDHKDIVNYLDKKHKILKSYQLKNYNELTKAFVKMKKRKNVNSEHTLNVLEIVGLTVEDDLRVFNQIFNADITYCVKEDKEPSIVLELLRSLIGKYSKAVNLKLQQQTLRKCMKLYTELLTNKEMNVNLTSLEVTLAKYFENKPNTVKNVSEDIFKKFFEAPYVRKSTSYLASVLLKYNVRLCSTFKEFTTKPEILSQRELTLPLGNAAINHNQFIIENKDFLATIYNEYKSNINKMLEKPHKAGQVYMNNSKFIRKLTLECMDVQECEKLFTKIHKFECLEISHLHLFQTVFLKLCSSELVKKEHLINYLLAMLNITTFALKENKDVNVVSEILKEVYSILQLSPSIPTLQVDKKDEFKKIIESAIWQNFCKAVLKDSLKVKTANQGVTIGPQLLCLLTNLVKLFYMDDHSDIETLFDMVTSHSEFLNVMLSHHSSDIKSRLIEFLYTLILRNKSVMKNQQVPVYLSSYHATRSPCDRLILAILYYYESNGLPVNEYKPYVWGDSGANHYAVRKNRTSSLWGHPTPNQVLNLFDREIIERTVRNFPVTLKLEYHYELPSNTDGVDNNSVHSVLDNMEKDGALKNVVVKDGESSMKALTLRGKYGEAFEGFKSEMVSRSHTDDDEDIYDPVFVFPLLSHVLAPGSAASSFKMLRSGLLALPVAALGSLCPNMRAAAYHVLHRFCMLLDTET